MKRDPQLAFKIPIHGGLRRGSGRKKLHVEEPAHTTRPTVDKRIPLHINFKLIRQAPSLRTPKFMASLGKILANARNKGLRVQQYTIESNHIHLIAESDSNEAVTRGMISLKVSISWALRRIFMFHGKVFGTRYYVHHLKTPTEMRNALRYVLFNHAKHVGTAMFADVYSSIFGFIDVRELADVRLSSRPHWFDAIAQELADAQTWMQRQGWRRGRQPTRKLN